MTIMPASAWVQAVFVCLFIVLIGILLGWFSKQQDKWQEFITRRDDQWKEANKDRDTQWQDANKDRDTQWQKWMDRTELRTAAQMADVTKALEKLTDKLDLHDQRVIEALDIHDDRVSEHIDKAQERKA